VANWVREFLAAHPEAAALPVVKRARRSLHLRRPDGKIEAHFTGSPIFYEATPGDWQPLDTEPQYDAARAVWHCPGLDVTVGTDATVRLGDYSQLTRRVGLFRPSGLLLLGTRDVPLGTRQGDALVADGDWWRVERRITETGYREWLTLKTQPSVPQAKAGDFLVLETVITGVSLPNGWVDDKYNISTHWSPAPVAWDANGDPLTCRRYWRDGVLYTGIPVEELAHALYPVVVDPDFIGDAADGNVNAVGPVYDTVRSTSTNFSTTEAYFSTGQAFVSNFYYCYRGYLKFDTNAIPDGATVTQVNLILVCTGDYSTADCDIQIVKQDWSAQDPIAAGNREAAYDNCLAGTADDNIWRNTLNIAINTPYTSGNLATAWINKIGNTYYSLRSKNDYENTTPTKNEHIRIGAQENATAGYRPVLTVLYEEEGPPAVPRAGVVMVSGGNVAMV